LNIWFRCQP